MYEIVKVACSRMGSEECRYCGSVLRDEFLSYRCNYCNETVCTDHRLPEKHDCPGLVYRKRSPEPESSRSFERGGRTTPKKPSFEQASGGPNESRRGASKTGQPRAGRTRAPGKTPDRWGTKGPDMNPDGSIKLDTDTIPDEETEGGSRGLFSPSTRRIILFTLIALAVVAICVQSGIADIGSLTP